MIRRQDTGCAAMLGAGLVPAHVTHGRACRCIIPVGADAEYVRLAEMVRCAFVEGILE
ncbi:hypothetical protein F5Y17DRAFT_440064 [Xylariaceae sp. FL0594]|nr:hypothetical protein F5Y17DRAFT_440064 [Xylariaceae sp. FL0594]